MTEAPATRPPLRLGIPSGYLGDEQALEAWRDAARRLRESGGPEVALEPLDLRAPDAVFLEPEGRVPGIEHLLAGAAAPDAFVWTGTLPWERVALARRGLAQPIDRLLRAAGRTAGKAGGEGLLAEYAPGALDALRDGRQVYGLPVDATPLLLMADFRLLGKVPAARPLLGAAPDSAAWTWAAFEETAARLLHFEPGAVGANHSGGPSAAARWGFAPAAMLPLDVLLWQHGAEFEAPPGAAASATAAGEREPDRPGAPRVVLEAGAARASLTLYARLLRAALGAAAALPVSQRPDRVADFQWGKDGMHLGGVPVALSVSQGVPRHRLPLAHTAGSGDPVAGTVGVAPLPRLPHRVGKGDPAATRLRVNRFVAVGAQAAQPAETALALHRLVALVGGAAAPIPARLPRRGEPPLPALTHLPAAERAAILEALAHSRAYPPAAEEALTAHLAARVARPLLEAPARPGALEEALTALLQLSD